MKNYLKDALVSVALLVFAFPGIGNAQTQKFSLRVRAYIDGSDYLFVRGNQIWYQHDSWKLPGKQDGHDDPTYLNDAEWYPTWNGSGNGAESEHHTLPTSCGTLSTVAGTTIYLSNNSTRCEVSISAQPSAGNSYTLKVYLTDIGNGAGWCDFTLYLGRETIGNYTWTYSIDNRQATVTGVSPESGNVSIPSSLGGCNVTVIGNGAFDDCTGLTSVTIPNSVTTIDDDAFINCTGLTSLAIPNSVTSIGDWAFYGCTRLTSVTIPSSLTGIGDYVFGGCYGIMTVTIPGGFEISHLFPNSYRSISTVVIATGSQSIGECVFYDCSGLTSVTIPNSVKGIGEGAFYGCSGLTSVTIPSSVTGIGWAAFHGCSGLTSVHISDLAAWCSISFGSDDANPLCYARHLFLNGAEVTNLVIPSSVTSIGAYAFLGCSGLTSVTIPNSVTSIGSGAFSGCSGLTMFVVGSRNQNYCSANGLLLSKDGKSLIRGINGNVVIPSSVTSIANYAFSGCSGLTSVTIPSSVTSIGSYAFSGCSGIQSVTIPGQLCMSSVFPSSYQIITKIIVTEGSKSIADSAFYGCSGLVTVSIPSSVTSIGNNAFSGCNGITSVTIPGRFRASSVFPNSYQNITNAVVAVDSTAAIASSAFSGCSRLVSVTIPYRVTSIGASAFSGCSSLVSVTIPNSVTSIGASAFQSCYGLISATIPNSVTSIEASTFRGCSRLTSVTIPNSVTSIGASAFQDCSGLTEMTIPSSVTSIGADAFSNCNAALFDTTTKPGVRLIDEWVVGYEASLSGTLDLTGCRGIAASAFSGCCNLTSVTIDNSILSVGDNAFSGCTNLVSVTIPGRFRLSVVFPNSYNITHANVAAGSTTIEESMFSYYYHSLASVTIPDTVTSIGNYAFYNCTGLTSITIPDSVTSIGSSAFSGCSGLVSVTIPGRFRMSSVFPASYQTMTNAVVTTGSTSIGASSFSGCSGLLSVSIPDSVTSIGEGAFSDCTRLYDTNSIPGVRLVDGWAVGYEASLTGDLILTDCRGIGDSAFKNSGGWPKSASESGANTIASPGLFQSKFNSRFNKTSPASAAVESAHVSGVICAYQRAVSSPWTFQDPVTGASFAWNSANTTFAYFGQMYMVAGRTYVFGTHFDDDSYVKVDGHVLIDVKSSDSGKVYTGIYVCNATGWYDVEFRLGDGSGEKGSWMRIWGADFAIGYRDDGLTDSDQTGWKRLIDPGDGSLLRCRHDVGITSITIPDSVTSIGNNAFQGCADLQSVYLPVRFRGATANIGLTSCCDLFFYLPFDSVAIGSELVWLSPGDTDWSAGEDANHSFISSGVVGNCATSSVETVVFGSGTLTFDWRISANRGDYYRIYLDGEVQKSITRSTAWATVTVSVPSDGEHVVRWSFERGSASAAGDDAAFLANVDWQPLSLKAVLDEPLLDWATDGEAPWIPQLAVTADGVAAVRSGKVIGEGISALETQLSGTGTLSWAWRIDSSGNSGVDVILDGEWLYAYEPSTGWSRETLEISDAGEHIVRFEYWNAGSGDDILDCAFIDMVSWSESTQSSNVTVEGITIPASWLNEKAASIVAAQSGDYEAAALATAANGVNKVWECYVAGLNPTNATDVFRTVISMEGGKPVIGWTPDLNEGGTKQERVYTVEGRESLTSGSWGPTNAASRFFRVKVALP